MTEGDDRWRLLRAEAERLVRRSTAGYLVVDDEPIDRYDRVYAYDPFGNRIELVQPLA